MEKGGMFKEWRRYEGLLFPFIDVHVKEKQIYLIPKNFKKGF